MAKTNPAQFVRQVRQEINRITWNHMNGHFLNGSYIQINEQQIHWDCLHVTRIRAKIIVPRK